MLAGGSIDTVASDLEASRERASRLIDIDTVEHTDAREVGAEWICLQALRELELDKLLAREGWSEVEVDTALAHLIVRTVYSPSELKSMRIMEDNSAVCELLSGEPSTACTLPSAVPLVFTQQFSTMPLPLSATPAEVNEPVTPRL